MAITLCGFVGFVQQVCLCSSYIIEAVAVTLCGVAGFVQQVCLCSSYIIEVVAVTRYSIVGFVQQLCSFYILAAAAVTLCSVVRFVQQVGHFPNRLLEQRCLQLPYFIFCCACFVTSTVDTWPWEHTMQKSL